MSKPTLDYQMPQSGPSGSRIVLVIVSTLFGFGVLCAVLTVAIAFVLFIVLVKLGVDAEGDLMFASLMLVVISGCVLLATLIVFAVADECNRLTSSTLRFNEDELGGQPLIPASDPDTQSTPSHQSSDH